MKKLIFLLLVGCCSAQTPVILAPIPQFVSYTQAGKPNAFGCVFSYASGTSTPINTWTDSTGVTLNPNPVILSGGGTANIWLASGTSYTLKVKSIGGSNCFSGSTLYTVNGIGGGSSVLTTVIPSSSSPTFNVISQIQLFTMTLTSNTAALPLNVVGIVPPGLITFQFTQDSGGGHTFTWPANMVGGAPVGLNANQVTTQSFIWNGTTAIATGPAVTGDGPSISEGDTTTGAITASGNVAVTGNITATGSISSSEQGTEIFARNEGVTGTTLNYLAVLTGSTSSAIIAPLSAANGSIWTSGVVGVVVGGAGITGQATIQQSGLASCVFDAGTTAGDFVFPSYTTAGQCSDEAFSSVLSSVNGAVGIVLTTNGSAGTYAVDFFPQKIGVAVTGLGSASVAGNTTAPQQITGIAIPATINQVGKIFRVTSNITIVAGGGASNQVVTWETSPAAAQYTALTTSSSSTTINATLQLTCLVTTSGSSGVYSCAPSVTTNTGTANSAPWTPTLNLGVVGTFGPGINLLCSFSVASTSNTCTSNMESIEVLN